MEDTELLEMFIILIISILVLIVTVIIKIAIDKRNLKGVETVEFYPPEGMNPARLGYFLDGEVDIHDVIGLIVYMEHKGYLQREIKKENGNDVIILHKGNEPKGEEVCVNSFYHELFKDDVDTVALTGEHKFNITESINLITKNLRQSFSKKPIFDPREKILKVSIFIILTLILFSTFVLSSMHSDSPHEARTIIASVFLFIFIGGYSYSRFGIIFEKQSTWKMRRMVILFILGFAVFLTYADTHNFNIILIMVVFAIHLIAFTNFGLLSLIKWRNNEYADLLGKTKGFRNFIKYAEKDKIDILAESDPQSFYDVLPYAYIFGVTDKWIKDEHAKVGEELIEAEIRKFLERRK